MHSAIHADHILKSLALAVARNQVGAMRPISEVVASEGLSTSEYALIAANPTFQQYLDRFVVELKDSGFSFEAKCKVLAEDLLPDAYHMVKDPDVPAAVRAKVIENLVEWGNLRPKNTVNTSSGTGFSITINIPQVGEKPPETIVLDAETPAKIENPPVLPVSGPKSAIFAFAEGDDFEYAGDDCL